MEAGAVSAGDRPSEPLTVREASAALGIPERTLRRHLARGAIRGVRLFRQSPWSIPVSEVERVARLMLIEPDWQAATLAKVADVADMANVEGAAA